MSWIETVAQVGGIGAVFAVVMFWIYRHDRKASEDRQRDDRKFMEDRLTKVIDRYSEDSRHQTQVQSGLSKSVEQLHEWLKGRNGNR